MRDRVCLIVLFLSSALAASAAAQQASGKFESKQLTVDIGGAYGYWDKGGGFDDGPIIKVAVSNAEFKAEMIDRWYDNLHGDVILTREGGVWLVSDELFQMGKRE